ncbi:hypothetical protein ANN_15817 [Periplaneta americana]|uniref:Uncharacterized protein n=1 Tax=Periplaneta americana TaxID=6978 RepID=A0ABQ8SHP6_PERAM|nr:hypothetical protein ANN_15817 [Periplaneta americana]
MNVVDKPRSGRPATAMTECNKDRIDVLVREDHRITISELCDAVSIGKPDLIAIIMELGLESELLDRYANEGDIFLSRIIIGDETWVHHY